MMQDLGHLKNNWEIVWGRHDTEHNDTQHNDIWQHNKKTRDSA